MATKTTKPAAFKETEEGREFILSAAGVKAAKEYASSYGKQAQAVRTIVADVVAKVGKRWPYGTSGAVVRAVQHAAAMGEDALGTLKNALAREVKAQGIVSLNKDGTAKAPPAPSHKAKKDDDGKPDAAATTAQLKVAADAATARAATMASQAANAESRATALSASLEQARATIERQKTTIMALTTERDRMQARIVELEAQVAQLKPAKARAATKRTAAK